MVSMVALVADGTADLRPELMSESVSAAVLPMYVAAASLLVAMRLSIL